MSVLKCGIDRRWCGDGAPFTGLNNEKTVMPFVSANGYYGYLPVYVDDSSAMETNDINDHSENNRVGTYPSAIESCPGNTMQPFSNFRSNGRCVARKITPFSRKRISSEGLDENNKKIRKEEPSIEGSIGYQVPLLQPTFSNDFHYPRCTMETNLNHENEARYTMEKDSTDLMEILLKQIHGCDLYNFYTSDDI